MNIVLPKTRHWVELHIAEEHESARPKWRQRLGDIADYKSFASEINGYLSSPSIFTNRYFTFAFKGRCFMLSLMAGKKCSDGLIWR